MIKVYFLPVETIGGIEAVAGSPFIHDAILETTDNPLIRKLIMNTTADEHNLLAALASETREPTQSELDLYSDTVVITPPDPDTVRAEELLSTSPGVITQPEMWELVRIFGKRLGYHF